jgi:SOS response associated peptidase (SRAP)
MGNRMINARAETLAEKPSFKRLLSSRRCLVPANRFYEWRREGQREIPMHIVWKDRQPFTFGGYGSSFCIRGTAIQWQGPLAFPPWGTKLSVERFMAVRKQILSVGLLLVFVSFVLSVSLARADIKPFGVYQPGRAHAGHRAGVGRTAAHNFKAGFVVAKAGRSCGVRNHFYKYVGFTYHAGCADRIAWVPETSFPSPQSFILSFSPVLNL